MAASNKTANLQLNQWVGTDPFRMADFNEDNQKIDAALGAVLGAMPRITAGTYTGDGAAQRMIALDFTPKAVFVFNADGQTYAKIGSDDYRYGGLALTGAPCCYAGQTRPIVSVETGGFKVYFSNTYKIVSNESGATLYYVALG